MRIGVWILLWMALLSGRFCGAEEATNFIAKLKPVPPFPSLRAAAKARGIPLAGMDRPAQTNALSPGDSVTTLVTLHEKHGRNTQWLIYFEATADSNSPPAKPPAPMVLYTSSGNKFEFIPAPATLRVRTLGPFAEPNSSRRQPAIKDKTASVKVNEVFLGLGLDRATAALGRLFRLLPGTSPTNRFNFGIASKAFGESQIKKGRKMAAALHLTTDEERSLAGGIPALLSYFNTVQQTPDLESILRRVLSMPSVWAMAKSLVKTGGMSSHIGVGVPEARVGPISLRGWDLPSQSPLYALPVHVTLCGHHALTVTLLVTAARPPLLLCSGIVGFLAENPDAQENYLTFRVISAHCRTGGPEAGSASFMNTPNLMRKTQD